MRSSDQWLRLASVRFRMRSPSRQLSRRSTAGGEFRFGTRSTYMASLNQADSRLSREKWNLHGYNLEADPRQPQRFRWFRLKRQGNFGLAAPPGVSSGTAFMNQSVLPLIRFRGWPDRCQRDCQELSVALLSPVALPSSGAGRPAVTRAGEI